MDNNISQNLVVNVKKMHRISKLKLFRFFQKYVAGKQENGFIFKSITEVELQNT